MTIDTSGKVSWPYAALMTFVWAILGAACATGTWAALTAVLEVARGASLSWFGSAFVAGLFFGGFVALLFLAPYWSLLLAYAALFARRPGIEQSPRRFLIVAFCFAIPVGLVVFVSFLDPWSPFGAFWSTALIAGPLALISAWCGIALPRLLIPSLRPGTWWVAA